MTTNDEIFKQLLELAENEEQIQYLTRDNDTIKDGKIETLHRDIGTLQHSLRESEINKYAAQEFAMRIVDRLISKATRYDYND